MFSTSQTLLPLLALLVSRSLCFQFTFPVPGKVDYKFAEGDIAIIEWSPKDKVIKELALNCGPDLGIDSDTPAYTLLTTNLPSGASYNIPDTWAGSNNKYCMFCTGNFNKACSGIFLLEELSKDSSPMVHALNGSHPQAQQIANPAPTLPITTEMTTMSTTTTVMTATSTTTTEITTTVTRTLESTTTTAELSQVGSFTDTTSCTTHLIPVPTQDQASISVEPAITTTASTLPGSTDISGTGVLPSGLCSLSTGSNCFPADASSTLVPSFNFPTPTASLQPESGVSTLRSRKSTLAGVIAIGVLALLRF